MISTTEIVCMLLLAIFLGIAIWWFVVANNYKKYLDEYSYSRGANVKGSGQIVNLSCDDDKEICVYRATQICSNPTSQNFETSSTDPIDSGLEDSSKMYGQFNPRTTVSRLDDMSQACNGKTTCAFNFQATDFVNGMQCDPVNTQLISTYTCIPKGTTCQSSG